MDIAAIVGTIVTSIVLGIGANLLTPKVSDWIGQRFKNVRSQSIKQINDEIAYITVLHSSTEKLIIGLFSYVFILVLLVSLLITCGFAFLVGIIYSQGKSFDISTAMLLGTGIVVFVTIVRLGLNGFNIINRIVRFEEYVESAQKRISDLEQRNQ